MFCRLHAPHRGFVCSPLSTLLPCHRTSCNPCTAETLGRRQSFEIRDGFLFQLFISRGGCINLSLQSFLRFCYSPSMLIRHSWTVLQRIARAHVVKGRSPEFARFAMQVSLQSTVMIVLLFSTVGVARAQDPSGCDPVTSGAPTLYKASDYSAQLHMEPTYTCGSSCTRACR